MSEKSRVLIRKLINAGENHLVDADRDLRYLQRSNFFALFVMALVPIFTPIFWWVGAGIYTLVLQGVFINSLAVWWLNKKGYSKTARFIQIGSFTCWLLFFCWLFGDNSGIQYLFLVFATMPFLFFPSRNIGIQIGGASFMAIGFIIANNNFLNGPELLDPEKAANFKYIIEILTFLWLTINFYYFNATTDLFEGRMKKSLDRLQQANREMEQFVYIASHDLQEPLRNVSSFSGLMLDDQDNLNDDQKTYLTFITRSISRMQSLIQSLMLHTKIGMGQEREAVDLNEVVEEVLEDLRLVIAESQVQIEVDQLAVVRGMRTELRLLFQNLIGNAIKFRADDRPVKVAIRGLIEEEKQLLVSIEDNGIGIAPENLGNVFLMFKRLNSKDKYEGSGIGLAHCQKIALLHGGKIEVESVLGQGSRFYFSLPIHKQAQSRAVKQKKLTTYEQVGVRTIG